MLRAARRVDPYDPSVAVECLAVDDQDLPGGVDRDAGGKGQKASGRDDTRLPGPGVDLDDGLFAEIGDQDVPRIERAGEASTGRQDENADEYADSRRVRNARHPCFPPWSSTGCHCDRMAEQRTCQRRRAAHRRSIP